MATNRIPFVDGLRGLAASMVCLLHCGMYSVAHHALGSSDAPLSRVVDAGRYGVQIFFVISGFVICLALRARVDLGFAGRFILRRIIRLDPPYWASIAFIVGLSAMIAIAVGEAPQFPSWKTVVAHLFYVQGILGIPSLSIVYWTLCIEVQFYLLFLVLTAISQHTKIPIEIVSAPLLITSLWLIDSSDSAVWIWPQYSLFWLGSAVANAYRGGGLRRFRWGVQCAQSDLPSPGILKFLSVFSPPSQFWRLGSAAGYKLGWQAVCGSFWERSATAST